MNLQVLSDSKLIIIWESLKCKIGNLVLNPLMTQVKDAITSFDIISFFSYFQEFNTQTNDLYKATLNVQEDSLIEQELEDTLSNLP